MQKKEIEAHFYRMKCFYNCKIQSKISLSELIRNSFFLFCNIFCRKKKFLLPPKKWTKNGQRAITTRPVLDWFNDSSKVNADAIC